MVNEWPWLCTLQNKASDYKTALFGIWREKKRRLQVILET